MSDFNTDIDLSDFGLDATEVFGSSDTEDVQEDAVDFSTDTEEPDVDSDNLDTDADTSFDWDQYADKPVKVKVQGEEIDVPFKELRDGYMRQADYTRKTQEAAELRARAEWAQQFQTALETDPQGTLRALQEAFGQPEPEVNRFAGIDDPELTPIVGELQATKAQLAEMQRAFQNFQAAEAAREQEAVLAEVRRELDSVKSKYPDMDVTETLETARLYGLPIEEAHLLLRGRKSLAGDSEAQKAAAKAAADAEIIRQKAAASQSVSSKKGGRGVEQDAPEYDSFEDLVDLMFKQSR